MKRYDQNFKTEALNLSDNIGVKKACEQLNVNDGRFIFSRLNSAAEKHSEFAERKRRLLPYAHSAQQCNSLQELMGTSKNFSFERFSLDLICDVLI